MRFIEYLLDSIDGYTDFTAEEEAEESRKMIYCDALTLSISIGAW